MTISVSVESEVSPRLVSSMMAETDAIWRPANITFLWRLEPAPANASANWIHAARSTDRELRVVVSNTIRPESEIGLPLGWIAFDQPAVPISGGAPPVPEAEVHVSSASALLMLGQAAGVVGRLDNMPVLERDTFQARAMGRALAHELGHYLLASKAHSGKGLMRAAYTAFELFGPSRLGFTIDTQQRQQIAERLMTVHHVAGR